MRIGVIGVGKIGGTLARRFVSVGHEVAVSNSRGPGTLENMVAELGEQAQGMTAEDAARFGDVVVVSVPFGRYLELPTGGVAGKIVIDTNNYYPRRDGHFDELDNDLTTSSELLQSHLSGARVVKAFNAIYWNKLRDSGKLQGTPGASASPFRATTRRPSGPSPN